MVKLHKDVNHSYKHEVHGLLKLGHQEGLNIKRAVYQYLSLPDMQESSLTIPEIQAVLLGFVGWIFRFCSSQDCIANLQYSLERLC